MIYRVSSRIDRATQRSPVSKTNKQTTTTKKNELKLGVVVHVISTSTWEAEADG